MKLLTTTALILSLAAPVHAGGPVIPEDMTETAPAPRKDRKIGGLVIGIIALAAIAALAGGSDNCTTPEPTPEDDGGC